MIDVKSFAISDYLKETFQCSCGKEHFTPMERIELSEGAINKVPDFVQEKGYKRIVMVADRNTYEAAGKQLEEIMGKTSTVMDKIILQQEEVIPDEKTVFHIIENIKQPCDAIVAVGSGTINDMCKYISTKLRIEYFVVATAPSMDGYASVGAALIVNNLKTTCDTGIAIAFFADLDILSKAPMDMITAGFGDIVGKYTCLMDWKLANMVNDEYYCPTIVEMVEESIRKVVGSAGGIKERSKQSVADITEALVGTGLAMSFVGNSRPASGGEHHISHYWEMKFMEAGRKPVFHGTKVGIGTVAILKLYEMLLEADVDFDKAKAAVAAFDKSAWEAKMRETYGSAADGVIALEKTAKKNDLDVYKERIKIIENKWTAIKETMESIKPTAKEVEDVLILAGAPSKPADIEVDDQMVRDGIIVAKEVRNRYGLLQLLWDLGLNETFADRLVEFYQEKKDKKKVLSEIKAFVLDMDGTIYLGNDLFPFTNDFLKKVTDTGRKYYFFTNNSSKSQDSYLDKLGRMEIPVTREQMMISTHVMIRYLKKNHPGQSVYVVGTESLLQEFAKEDMIIDDQNPDVVILGFDTSLTYEKLVKACDFIRDGKVYYGINPDLNCPLEGGAFIPDCGSMARLIESSTGVFPEFFGKPSRHTLEYIVEKTGCKESEIAVIGDRLYTDIAVTGNSEAKSILVLSGESTVKDVETAPVKPTLIYESLAEVLKDL